MKTDRPQLRRPLAHDIADPLQTFLFFRHIRQMRALLQMNL
jgi:hypothetical protein